MASREFEAFQTRAAAQPKRPAPKSLVDLRAQIESALAAAPLAAGVEHEAVEVGGVPAIWLRRASAQDVPILCYFHGGGYRMGSALGWRAFGSHLADACHARVLLVDYRLAPEHSFPAAVDDAVAVYSGLLRAGEDPRRIVLAGDSAGGGLAAAALLAAPERDLPLPAGAALLSPWLDLTNTAETFRTGAGSDRVFSKSQADEAAALYLAGGDPRQLLASPLLGEWKGKPPLLVHVGDTEVLLDDARGLATRARAAGVEVRLSIYPEMPHVWHLSYPAFPEAVKAVEEIAAFVADVTGV